MAKEVLASISELRLCTKCGESKNLSEFWRDKTRKDGLYTYCKSCSKKPKLCHRKGCTNIKRYGRSYRYCSDECARIAHLTAKKVSSRAWRDGNRNELRTQQLWTRYHMTVEDYDKILESQAGRCAICSSDTPGGMGTWHIDHDHNCCPDRTSCGSCIRGLLCARCNFFILSVVEGPLLNAALQYIEYWNSEGRPCS